MSTKPALSIADQIALLKSRGMIFGDEAEAERMLETIGYYRLKGYWQDAKSDLNVHIKGIDTQFETVCYRYELDRQLRIILFEAIEIIEVALRTRLINHLSIKAGSSGLWYLDSSFFNNGKKDVIFHQKIISDLRNEFSRSKDIFAVNHKKRYGSSDPEAWKIIEVASFGTLSKIYSTLLHNLPEKINIAKSMGLNHNSELTSWITSISYVRNIVAHHSRLWNRDMVKMPIENINNPKGKWFNAPLVKAQKEKPFLAISCMLYLCNAINPDNKIKEKLLYLISTYLGEIYKLDFVNNWQKEPIWS